MSFGAKPCGPSRYLRLGLLYLHQCLRSSLVAYLQMSGLGLGDYTSSDEDESAQPAPKKVRPGSFILRFQASGVY